MQHLKVCNKDRDKSDERHSATHKNRRRKLQIYIISCEIVQPAVQKRTSGNILQDLKVLALTFLH